MTHATVPGGPPGAGNSFAISIACAAALLAAPLAAAKLPERARECETVTFGGDIATCDATACILGGDAFLVCDDLKLWAQEIEVRWTAERDFSGAVARGNALLVDRNTVITCETIELEQDRIRGRVEAATVRSKTGHRLDERGIPQGRDSQILHGDIERPSRDELRIFDGDFTLCDCGDDPPSWRVDSPEIEVELGERAFVWWPMLYISPFGLGPIPITPPLLPISVPLQERALGFLPPAITFYGPYPMIDLPFFIPLGDSWDVTIAPGLRTDWIRKHDIQPSRWGAPRLGGRLRYAPFKGLSGELRVQWTWDRRLYIARTYLAQNDLSDPLQMPDLSDADRARLESRQLLVEAHYRALAALEHRVTIDWEQDFQITDDLRWQIDIDWPSDDRLRQDFGVTLSEQVANYVPSRSQVLWTPTGLPMALVGSLAADHLVVIGNNSFRAGEQAVESYLNWRGPELHVPHRGPAARLTMLPLAPAPDFLPSLYLDADASFTRLGSWDPADPAFLQVAAGQLGVAWRDSFGGLNIDVEGRAHGTWTWLPWEGTERGIGTAFAHVRASASTVWARRFGALVHTINPRLLYHVVPVVESNSPSLATFLRGGADEHLDAGPFHQMMVSLDQALWSSRGARVADLRLGLPFDLETNELAPLQASVAWRAPYIGTGSAWLGVAFHRPQEPVEEIGAQMSLPIGPVAISGTYFRFAPSAERFNRGIYALFGTSDEPADPAAWVHALSPSLWVRTERFTVGYSAIILLPLPGEMETDPARPFLSQNVLFSSYQSACDCWQIGLRCTMPGYGTEQEILERLKVQVTFAVGDYSIGNIPQ